MGEPWSARPGGGEVSVRITRVYYDSFMHIAVASDHPAVDRGRRVLRADPDRIPQDVARIATMWS
jgi:hypothetical protein